MNKVFNENYEMYYDKGLIVIPLKGKNPNICGEGWQDKNFNLDQTLGNNIGLITGKRSGVIVLDIDIKDKVAQEKIYSMLPPIYCGKIGNKEKGRNYFFQYNGEVGKKIKLNGNTAVELLSTGNQTVLPPSIHPDFNYAYEWINKKLYEIDIDDLPMLPIGVIDEIEKYIKSLESGESISIGESGRNNTLYSHCCAKIADGVLADQAIQELYDYDIATHEKPYFLDKKEIYKGKGLEAARQFYYQTALNLSKANKLPPVEKAIEFTIGEPIKEYKKNFKKLPKLPNFGAVIFDELYNNSPIPRTQLCFMNTLNIISILVGSKYSYRGTFCNLYQYGIAPSGYGKDFSFKRSRQLLIQAGCSHLIGSSSPTSDTVVLNTLEENRDKVMFINEAESLLKRISDDRRNHGVREVLTDLFDDGGKQLAPKYVRSVNQKDGKKLETIGDVFSPFVNILMTSTEAAFEQYASQGIFNTGLLNRFLFFFEDRYKKNKYIEDYNPPIPENIISMVRSISGKFDSFLTLNAKSMSETFEINKALVSDEAKKEYLKMFDKIEDEKAALQGTKFAELFSRKLYFVNKFTILHHVMKNPETFIQDFIQAESLIWAKAAVDAIMHNMIQHLDDNVSSSSYGRILNQFTKYIKSRTVKGKETTRKEISNRFSGVDKTLRDKIIKDLEELGHVVKNNVGKYVYVG